MVLFAPVPNSPFKTNGVDSHHLAVGDFNNDNHLDVVVANNNSGNISLFFGNGTGGFSSPSLFEGLYYPERLDTGDFNLDGNLDIVVVTGTDFSSNFTNYSVLLGDGNGSFTDNKLSTLEGSSGSVTQDVTVGDFNKDGIPDLAFALDTVGGKLGIHLGDGFGGFNSLGLEPALSGFGINPNEIITEDFNSDGFLDLAVTFEGREPLEEGLAIFLGNDPLLVEGSANSSDPILYFNEPIVQPVIDPASLENVFTNPRDMSVGDFNNDDIPDLAIVEGFDNNISILIGNGDGTFTPTPIIELFGYYPYYGIHKNPVWTVDVADFNNDGNDDLAVQASTYPNTDVDVLLLGDGAGNFKETTRVKHSSLSFSSGIITADFNEDNKPDIVSVRGWFNTDGDNEITVSLNTNTLKGTGADDRLTGSTEKDTLIGRGGNDELIGKEGNDTLKGSSGNDNLDGGEGSDRLIGNNGNDTITGGADNDTLLGGSGEDSLFGEAGNDSLKGGNDNDYLDGGEDGDRIVGNGGNDTLIGGAGKDSLTGGSGDDLLYGGAGINRLTGGGGSDTFVIESLASSDRNVIRDYVDGIDLLGLADGLTFTDLTIANDGTNTDTLIIDNSTNNTLAVLIDINASVIESSDFVAV